jgi:DNA polymerase I-like protein with 3'-5' exonuclease and polymerase domains
MKLAPTTLEAYRFFHAGTRVLSEIEHNGIRVDVDYLDAQIAETRQRIEALDLDLKNLDEYKVWRKRFAQDANLDSVPQLGAILEELGFKSLEKTPTGLNKWDERALDNVGTPFVKTFVRRKKLSKALNTYLLGIKREVIGNRLHPCYNLAGGLSDEKKGGARSYRGSCSDPNFTNMPIRNKEIGRLIRTAFIARPGWLLGEIDFSTIEVRIAACVTKDRRLIDYMKDKKKDMHRDRAGELFFMDVDYMVKYEKELKKGPRDAAKNRFVFPQFYGSYYVDCARNMWEWMERGNYTMPGIMVREKVDDKWIERPKTVKEHLAENGVKARGKCDPDRPPKPGTFEYHVKQVEDHMWNKVFTEYTAWKKTWYANYLETGEVHMPTGFVARGQYRRNQVLNLPIQGPAYHCLLWATIEIQKELTRRRMRTKLVGKIHDCLLAEIHPAEVQEFLDLCHDVMTVRLPKAWKWIIVPLEIEVDVVPVGMSWSDKELWVKNGGKWLPKASLAV